MKTWQNVSMAGTCKSGFSFLELLVAILLISLMATIIVPNLQDLVPGYKKKAFLSDIATLINLTWQQAISTGKLHRIYFDFETQRIEAQVELKQKEQSSFESFSSTYGSSSIIWPDFLQPREFFINGEDELKKIRGEAKKIWFYISPEGQAQPIILNCNDTRNPQEKLSMVLNPFTLQLKTHDTFQKP